MRIAILGGTGPEGLGIAARLAKAGEAVIVGSRVRERAERAVRRLDSLVPGADVHGATNEEAAGAAEVVFVTVPWGGIGNVIETCGKHLAEKVIVDTVVPLRVVDGHFDLENVAEGSASQRLQASLPRALVVGAFKNQSAVHLLDIVHPVEGDVLVCGDDAEARRCVEALVLRVPDLRPVDAGDLRSAHAIEQVTALILNLNRRHGARASLRLTGLPEARPTGRRPASPPTGRKSSPM